MIFQFMCLLTKHEQRLRQIIKLSVCTHITYINLLSGGFNMRIIFFNHYKYHQLPANINLFLFYVNLKSIFFDVIRIPIVPLQYSLSFLFNIFNLKEKTTRAKKKLNLTFKIAIKRIHIFVD